MSAQPPEPNYAAERDEYCRRQEEQAQQDAADKPDECEV